MNTCSSSLAQLLTLTSQGCEHAFSEIFGLYKNKVFSVAYKLTKDVNLAEEIVQETFLKIWLKRTTLPSIEVFDTYLVTIARNLILNEFKKKTTREKYIQHLSTTHNNTLQSSTTDYVYFRELENIFEQALDQLSPKQREVFLLAKEDKLKRKEIAVKLSIAPETVKTHLAHAVKSVKRHIEIYLTGEIIYLIFTIYY